MADNNASLSEGDAVDDIASLLDADDSVAGAVGNEQAADPIAKEKADLEAVGKQFEDQPAEPEKKAEAAETPSIEPPEFWDADSKERFKSLGPDLQKTVAEKEREREAFLGKTQREAAEVRKAAEADRATVQQERQSYAERLTHFIDMAVTLDPVIAQGRKTDWQQALADDPINAPAQHLAYQLKEQKLAQVIQERQRVQGLQAQEQNKLAQEQFNKANERLAEELKDDWAVPEKRKVFQAQIKEHLLKAGYEESELSGLNDPRAILQARDAMMYRKLMAEQATIIAKKKQPAPIKIQSVKSSDGANGNQRADALWKRAAKSSRTDDTVDAVMAVLNS